MNSLVVASVLLLLPPRLGFGIDKVYLGVRAGNVTFSGTGSGDYKTAVGYGVDVSLLRSLGKYGDVTYTMHSSPHSGLADVTVFSQSVSAELRPLDTGESFLVSVGAGPGFHIFKLSSGTRSSVGLTVGATIDYIARRNFHIGFSSKMNFVANSPVMANLFTFMVRVGYSIKL